MRVLSFPVLLVVFAVRGFSVAAPERPNVLWITAEDLSPHLGSYGDPVARTPHLDAFAREAVRYTRAFAAAPVCSPSRATLISGVWANSLGNPHLRCEGRLPDGLEGYPSYLRSAGYFTSNDVKTDYNLRDEAAAVRRWWDRCAAGASWRQRAAGQSFFSVINLMETHQSRTSVWPEAQFEQQIGRRLAAAERADPKQVPVPPFYPDTAASRQALARYYDCIAAMDRRVGEILRALADDGLAEDTIVFFYGDHGMGMPRGKRLLHDSGMRVPLLIRFPRKWAHLAPAAPGAEVGRLVTFVDFAPTVLSLAGVPIPRHYQGVAFLGAAAGLPRRLVYGARDRVDEVFDTARSVRDGRWLYVRNYRPHLSWAPPEGYSDGSPFRRGLTEAARQGLDGLGTGATAWLAASRPREELYDVVADPFQIHNLAQDPAHAATLAAKRAELRQWQEEIRDVAVVPEQIVAAQSGGRAPYDWARQSGSFALARILAAAEAVGDPGAAGRQRQGLADAEAAVRYWSAVGLRANPAAARDAVRELERALDDGSPAVRIEAAVALVGAGQGEKGLPVLRRALTGEDLDTALQAARGLQGMDEGARPVLGAMRERLTLAKQRQEQVSHELYLAFSLGAACARLESSR
ncbi:MAG: sulfatase-like hydrolase/transferase [Verrucomicrobia bacterium]|nr:sulfatase-like hydrolase/transferase [Verrucomicrobiota bacterium]